MSAEEEISKGLGIDINSNKSFNELFKVLDTRMRDKYLSHLVSVCEDLGRKALHNQEFCINLIPRYVLTQKDRDRISATPYQQETKKRKIANPKRINNASKLIRSRHIKSNRNDSRWEILYPASNKKDEKEKEIVLHMRIAVAHEIGHLIVFLLGKSGKYKEYDLLKNMLERTEYDIKKVEQFCDFFAVMAIHNKDEFYKRAKESYVHKEGIDGNIKLLKKYKDLENY